MEQVPLLEEGGIDAFLRREVLPYAPDTWHDTRSVRRVRDQVCALFLQAAPMRTLDEIRADILALERETEGLLMEIVG